MSKGTEWSKEEDTLLTRLTQAHSDPLLVVNLFNREVRVKRPERGIIQRAMRIGLADGRVETFRRADGILRRRIRGEKAVEEVAAPTIAAALPDRLPPKPFFDRAAVALKSKEVVHLHLLVGPEEAKALLFGPVSVNDPNNRKLNTEHVARLAADMIRGEWGDTGEPVIVTKSRHVGDGQHRLHAIIKADRAIPLTVAFGVSDDAIKYVDTGAERKVAETMRRDGIVGASEHVAWANYGRIVMLSHTTKMTRSAMEQYETQYADAILWGMDRGGAKSNLYARPTMVAMLVFAYPTNPKAIDEFYKELISDTTYPQTYAISVARNYILQMSGGKRAGDDRRTRALKLLRCIKAYIENAPMSTSHLYATEDTLAFFAKAHPADSILRTL